MPQHIDLAKTAEMTETQNPKLAESKHMHKTIDISEKHRKFRGLFFLNLAAFTSLALAHGSEEVM